MASHEDFTMEGIRFYMNKQEAEDHIEDIRKIVREIAEGLKDSNEYGGLSFIDVSGKTIQVNLFNKKISRYSFHTVELKRDWSNVDEVIEKSIEYFKKMNNKEYVGLFQNFISDCEKYGWD